MVVSHSVTVQSWIFNFFSCEQHCRNFGILPEVDGQWSDAPLENRISAENAIKQWDTGGATTTANAIQQIQIHGKCWLQNFQWELYTKVR